MRRGVVSTIQKNTPIPLTVSTVEFSENPHENIKKSFEILARVLLKNTLAYENKLGAIPTRDILAVSKLHDLVLKSEMLEAALVAKTSLDYTGMTLAEIDAEIEKLEQNGDNVEIQAAKSVRREIDKRTYQVEIIDKTSQIDKTTD